MKKILLIISLFVTLFFTSFASLIFAEEGTPQTQKTIEQLQTQRTDLQNKIERLQGDIARNLEDPERQDALLKEFADTEKDLREVEQEIVSAEDGQKFLDGTLKEFEKSFITSTAVSGEQGIVNLLLRVARDIKNFIIAIAILIGFRATYGIIFSKYDEDDLTKYRGRLIWVGIGIFMMQISYAAIRIFLDPQTKDINGGVADSIIVEFVNPVLGFLFVTASVLFIAMAFYSYFLLVTAGSNDEQAKKGKTNIINAIVGMIMLQLVRPLMTSFYGDVCPGGQWVCRSSIEEAVGTFGVVLNYINGFLAFTTIALIIYAGWLVLSARGEEEKINKAKRMILWIVLGFLLLVGSFSLFNTFTDVGGARDSIFVFFRI